MTVDQITPTPDAAVSMGLQVLSTHLSSKDKGENQASKIIGSWVCCYQLLSLVGACGVKREHQLRQVVILCPWTLRTDQMPANKDNCRRVMSAVT